MKKIILLPTLALLLFSCGKADNKSIESIIASNNTATISAKKAELQVQITQLEEALSKLDTVKEEVLVAIQPVKDSLFAHYLEIQGNINTKENVLIQPEIPGALVALHVKAGQAVSKGQVLGRVDDGGIAFHRCCGKHKLIALSVFLNATRRYSKGFWVYIIGQ